MSTEQMRDAIRNAYNTRTWKSKVAKMSGKQVLAIYNSFKERGINMSNPIKASNDYTARMRSEDCLTCANIHEMQICSACHTNEYYKPIPEVTKQDILSDSHFIPRESYMEEQLCFIIPTREEEMEEQGPDISCILFGEPKRGRVIGFNSLEDLTGAEVQATHELFTKLTGKKQEEEKMKVKVEFKNRFSNDTMWITQSQSYCIKDMETSHILNCLRMFCTQPDRTLTMCVNDIEHCKIYDWEFTQSYTNNEVHEIDVALKRKLLGLFTSMDQQALVEYAMSSVLASKMRKELYARGVNVEDVLNMFLRDSNTGLSYDHISYRNNREHIKQLRTLCHDIEVEIADRKRLKFIGASDTFKFHKL